MVKLKFKIESYYSNNRKFKIIYISNNYDDTLKLSDILKSCYKKYGIDNKEEYNIDIFNINKLFWHKHFSDSIIANLEYNLSDYENLTLKQLEKQFSISNLEIPLCLNYNDAGRSVGDSNGISFYFHSNEKDLHHVPHIHCKYSGIETRINIANLTVIDRPFKKNKMDYALNIVKENQKDLLLYWQKVIIDGESLKFNLKL